MPKYCSAPNCKNDAKNSDRKSFYKFPLNDAVRLKQWLGNMGREDWTPSRHQHLCHEHFTPSSFTMRWGIRYLANNAVPTIFNLSENAEKRRGGERAERNPKRQRGCGGRALVELAPADLATPDGKAEPLQLYAITVDPSLPGQTAQAVLLDPGSGAQTLCPMQAAAPLAGVGGHVVSVDELPASLFQTVGDPGEQHLEVLVKSEEVPVKTEEPAGSEEEEKPSLAVENVALEMAEPSAAPDDRGAQIIAYFETIPNVLPAGGAAATAGPAPDTVLSSALSATPIVSTLPIVSKHLPPSPASLVLTLERLENPGGAAEDGCAEPPRKQLEEHRYHKNSLSKEQLEAIVMELQKKVKVLQQRHRRHLDKLLGLESTVSQLRHSNLVNEERLQLLEKAYIQTSAAVSDAGETVAIICEEENTAYLYALPKSEVDVEMD